MSERRRYFFAFEKYADGVLPESGGLVEQSAIWVEAFEVIEDALATVKRERSSAPGEADGA